MANTFPLAPSSVCTLAVLEQCVGHIASCLTGDVRVMPMPIGYQIIPLLIAGLVHLPASGEGKGKDGLDGLFKNVLLV